MSDLPTTIYWLFDTRPETIAESGWQCGVPFYCGKTQYSKEARLLGHKIAARNAQFPITRKVFRKLQECGDHVRIDCIELVPAGGRWRPRERYWIKILRSINPECANTRDGGDSVMTVETRNKLRASLSGRTRTPMQRVRHSTALIGRKASDETKMLLRQRKLGKKLSPEHKTAISRGLQRRQRMLGIDTSVIRVDSAGVATIQRQSEVDSRLIDNRGRLV